MKMKVFLITISIIILLAIITIFILNYKQWFVKPTFSGRQTAKHLVVISVDAMGETDWEEAKTLPNFSELIKNGSSTKSLRSVFPTLTYVVHTTMVTGVYPDKHGITHNHQLQPGIPDKDQSWYWYRDQIKVPTIYDLARENDMTTAGLLWPVTGKASIDYNFPEIIALKGENQTFKVLKNGTLTYLASLELRLGKYRKGTDQPYLDDFAALCAADTIKKKKPNLTLIHLTDLDTMKHEHRVDSREAGDALKRQDGRIGEIIKAAKDAGIYNDTVFVVTSDHSQFNIDYKVYLNNLLANAGLIKNVNGALQWRAYCQTTGGSAYLHVKDGDSEAEAKAIEVIRNAAKDSRYGIEEIYDRKKLNGLHADKTIKYAIEAKPGYEFLDELSNKDVVALKDVNETYATHGFSPDEPNYKCIFIAAGPGIKKGNSIGNMEMVDIAPTLARILGLEFYKSDGRVVEQIFEKKD